MGQVDRLKVHLRWGRTSSKVACGLVAPQLSTTTPAEVTCLNCIKSPRMADVEVASLMKRGRDRFSRTKQQRKRKGMKE